MLLDFFLTPGQKVYLIQAKKISFVETGKNAEYSIWGARNLKIALKSDLELVK